MESLKHEAEQLFHASLASSTWVTYRKGVERFINFRNQVGLSQVWPVPESHLLLFISFLSIEDYAPSTISTHIAALSFVHNANGWVNSTESFLVRKLKEGCRRTNTSHDFRLPITPPLLGRLISILPVICKSYYEAQLFSSAFLLAFYGFLRVGEFAKTTSNRDLSKLISLNDVRISNAGIHLTIRYSKTDQRGLTSVLQITGSSQPKLCPVKALSAYLESRPCVPGPLFIHFNGEVISANQFSYVLKEGIKLVGLCPKSFGSHSFRIGAATAAAINGVSEELIKLWGRWRSSCYRRYIRPCDIVV